MPIARIQLDDGRIARIEVPEGTTPEQAMAFAQSQAKPSRQEAAKAERSGMARGLGLGVRNVAEGIGNLAGIVANPAIATINAMGGNLPEYSTALSRTLTAAGLPEPETEGERVMGRVQREVAGVIPTMGAGLALSGLRGAAGGVGRALAEKPLIQAAGAAGSGLSAQMAQEAGAGPVGETLASLGGAIGATGLAEGAAAMGRAGSAMLEPFKQAGRERIAADVLLRSSADPENLGSRIAAGLDDPMRRLPKSPATTAQAARDPGLMVLEQGLRSDAGRSAGQGGMSGAVAFRDVEAARNAAREKAFARMGDALSPEERGSTARDLLSQSEREGKVAVSRAYQQAEKASVTLPIDDLKVTTGEVSHKYFGPGSGGVPKALADVMEEIGQATGPQGFEWTQNMRARLGEIKGQAAANNENRLAAAAGAIRQSLDDLSDNALQEAAAARRNLGATFGRDESGTSAVGRILKKDPYGAPIMPDARVASEILANPQNLNQTIKAAGKRADEIKAVLRGQFVDNLMQATRTSGVVADAAGNVSNVLSPAQFKRFFDKNSTVAKQIFDKPGQFMALQRLANDFAETAMVSATGRARGSDTAQNLSVGNLIARASNGLIDPSSPIAQTLVGIGPIGRLLYTAPEAATRELLIEAARDPKFARILLEKAGPDGVKRAAAYLNGSAGDRIRQALSDASIRLQAQSTVSQQNEGPY